MPRSLLVIAVIALLVLAAVTELWPGLDLGLLDVRSAAGAAFRPR